jgi:hypothetical protein
MLFFVPRFELLFRVDSYRRLNLRSFHGVPQCQMIVLAYQRKEHSRNVSFERQPRNDSLMKMAYQQARGCRPLFRARDPSDPDGVIETGQALKLTMPLSRGSVIA